MGHSRKGTAHHPEEACCLSSGHGNQGIHSNTFMWFLGGCLHQSRDHPDTTALGMRQYIVQATEKPLRYHIRLASPLPALGRAALC